MNLREKFLPPPAPSYSRLTLTLRTQSDVFSDISSRDSQRTDGPHGPPFDSLIVASAIFDVISFPPLRNGAQSAKRNCLCNRYVTNNKKKKKSPFHTRGTGRNGTERNTCFDV